MSLLETIQLKTLKINVSSIQPISTIFQACNLENAGQARMIGAQLNKQTCFSIHYKLHRRKLHSQSCQEGIIVIEPHGHKTTHCCCESHWVNKGVACNKVYHCWKKEIIKKKATCKALSLVRDKTESRKKDLTNPQSCRKHNRMMLLLQY